MRYSIFCLIALLLLSCGPILGMKAWKQLKKSKTIYKECLIKYPENPNKCLGYRKAYEADVKAYGAIMGRDVGIRGDLTIEQK